MVRTRPVAIPLLVALAALVLLAAALRPARTTDRFDPELVVERVDAPRGPEFHGPPGTVLRYTLDGRVPDSGSPVWSGAAAIDIDKARRTAERLLRTPTSPQWRAPLLTTFRGRTVVRIRAFAPDGRTGPVENWIVDQWPNALPSLSVLLDPASMFDPDTGLYVPGMAVFRTGETFVRRYRDDQRWWKYPGNYHHRGKRWERQATVVWEDDEEVWEGTVGLRINGNNTRGFPQHALRVLLGDGPHDDPGILGAGHRALVLRAGGNDQDRTLLRDAIAHRLASGLGFHTSASRSCVVHLNGAYWGLHQARERMDEHEVARRCGVPRKDIALLADRGILEHGREQELHAFMRALAAIDEAVMQGSDPVPALEALIDVEGFLTYVAVQVIIGNSDWPDQNVKYWRYVGDGKGEEAWHDGRWRFMMGDSDLSLGYPMPASYDAIAHIATHTSPVARLFKACMAVPAYRSRFEARVGTLLAGPFAPDRAIAVVDSMAGEIAGEVPHHVARWRRPLSVDRWQEQVEALRAFLRVRPRHVADHLNASTVATR
ncbi:MAG: CotH kinase family protein [Flavobacteriales bacterium]|nr:CotH kinase family protein [Flavobacteriales bacterium]